MPLPSLGRKKDGRHREPALEQQEAAPDHELENYLAALAPEGDVETTGSGRRFGNAQVYQLRLTLTTSDTPHLAPTLPQAQNLAGGVYAVQRNAAAASYLEVPLAPADAFASCPICR